MGSPDVGNDYPKNTPATLGDVLSTYLREKNYMFFRKLGKSSEITAYYTKYTAVLVNTAKIGKLSAPDGAIRASKNLWTSICLKVIQLNCGVRPKHCDIWGTVIPPMY